jgi:subfamily B ATP-binding cassette protein MsbA
VHFCYQEGQEILKGVNFTIPAGKTVGIIGNSGSGKTSLVFLLARLYDVTAGSIEIDDKDIRTFPVGVLRKSMSMVFQDNFLFSGTIRENILLGNLEANEEDLQKAIDAAHLRTLIQSLPSGIDSPVGERGTLLSGGQKQRIAIARAIIRNSPIVILDEATSALDNQSEALVQEALDNLTKNKTVLIIAHRLSTLNRADFIVALDDGRITELGTAKELLKNNDGTYSRLQRASSEMHKDELSYKTLV